MFKVKTMAIDTYAVGIQDFMVEIIDNVDEDMWESWIYRKSYGVKQYMFGEPKKQSNSSEETTYAEYLERVEDNLVDYMKIYNDEVF